MLNKIVAAMNGSAGDPAVIDAALMQLARDRDEVRKRITELESQKRELLFNDASDADLDKIDRLIDRATIRLEKLSLTEGPLREKLAAARIEMRSRDWASRIKAIRAADVELIASMRETAAKHAARVALVTMAQQDGFAAEVASFVPMTPTMGYGHLLCAPELIDLFERSISPISVAARPSRSAPVVQRAPVQARPPVSVDAAMTRQKARRPPDDMAELEPGQARVRVLRHGYSPDDASPACAEGQIIRMPLERANQAARNGAVDIVTRRPPEHDYENERTFQPLA